MSQLLVDPGQSVENFSHVDNLSPNSPAQAEPGQTRKRRIRPRGAVDRALRRSYLYWQEGRCCICQKADPKPTTWHHINHDTTDWSPNNVRLTHGNCNSREGAQFWRGKGEREGKQEVRNISWESSRSMELGPTFDLEIRRLLLEAANDKGPDPWVPTVKNVENRLAKICGCGQAVVSRWIEREATTPEGDFMLSERTVSDHRRKRTMQVFGFKPAR